jgi:hypothetical protein
VKAAGVLVLAWLLAGCSPAVDVSLASDPGREASETVWWCSNASALPDPHDHEYRDGRNDHPCSERELATACRYLAEVRSSVPPYCGNAE